MNTITIFALLAATLLLPACATGNKVRSQMLADLSGIVNIAGDDCPTACDTLKQYIQAKLQEAAK